MNKSMVTGLVIGAAVAVGGGAVAGLKMMNRQLAYATVTNVTPLTRTVRTPRQACHDEQVTHTRPAKDQHDVVGTVAGAVVGGLLGNQVGGGHGRDLATVAGAAAGGYAGNRIQKKMQDGDTYTTDEQRCATLYDTTEKQVGYEVHYRLGDKQGKVRMDHDPGERIPVGSDGKLMLDSTEGKK